MMRSRPMAIVTAPAEISFEEVPLPPLAPTDVMIRVKVATICGSDLHLFKGKHPAAQPPVPVGHELAGEVVAVGDEVTRLALHDRVAVEPVVVCGVCAFCQRGDYHLCRNISFQYRQGQGALTPYYIADQRWLHRLPDSISYIEGALLEPLAVCVHAVRRAESALGDRAVIFGDGAIGLLTLQVARLAGMTTVYLVGKKEARLDMARSLGAAAVVDGLKEDPVAFIQAETGGMGVERAFEAVGRRQTLVQALRALKKGGTAVLVGLFEQPEVALPVNLFVQKEITLTGSQGYAWDFQRAIEIVEAGQMKLSAIVSHQFPLREVQQAFELLLEPNSPAVKVAILVDEEDAENGKRKRRDL
ncbi:MAG: alcohol dehydrogenase catalytic domain-containing protein [Chloroflexi bacterium]|nr:alcohol dehydrogenase catalytic domain-containing protein [Chloroflexota bacterium]